MSEFPLLREFSAVWQSDEEFRIDDLENNYIFFFSVSDMKDTEIQFFLEKER